MEKKIPPLASKQLEPLITPLSDVKPHPDNYKIHTTEQLQSLRASLNAFGCTQPIKANLEGFIVAGHGMYQLYLEDGYTHAPVIYEALDKRLSKAYLVADNETARKAETDNDKLALLLEDAASIPDFDFEATGFELGDLDSLLNTEPVEVVEDEFNPDDVVETRCKDGDLWFLGSHRVLCGDSTIKENIERLVGGLNVDMVFTDPPYGIDWNTDYTRFRGGLIPSYNNYDKITDDEKEFDPSYWLNGFNKCLFFGANCFSNKLPKGNWIVWDKRFENGEAFLADAEVAWYNGSGAVYIISETHQGFVSSDQKRYHPTQKPIKLIEKCFEQIKAPNILLDPYAGSGSTLITCEQTGRTCLCSEISPKYCDVILQRWEQFTGQTATKVN